MESSLPDLLSYLDYWQIAAVLIKAAMYGASFTAGGGVFFLLTFSSCFDAKELGRIRVYCTRAALAGIVFTASHIAVMNGMLSGEWSGMFSYELTHMVLASRMGIAVAIRLVGFILIAFCVNAKLNGRLFLIPFVGAVMVVVSFALTGHANELAQTKGFIPVLLVCLHLLAISFWLGALRPLHSLTTSDDIRLIAIVMHRFGQIAMAVVGILIASGTLLLYALLGSVNALWQTAYGQMVVGKLACVALLLCFAATNKLSLTPRLLNGDHSVLAKLRHSIVIEMMIALLILIITAGFTTVSGPSMPS